MLICAVAFCLTAAAQNAATIVEKYGKLESSEFVSLDRKTFNLLKPMMGLDKQTRQLFKALDIRVVDMLNMEKCSEEEKASLVKELESLVKDGHYLSARELSEDVDLEEGSDFIFAVKDETITDFVIYASKKDGSLVVMRIGCNGSFAKMKEVLSLQGDQGE